MGAHAFLKNGWKIMGFPSLMSRCGWESVGKNLTTPPSAAIYASKAKTPYNSQEITGEEDRFEAVNNDQSDEVKSKNEIDEYHRCEE
ncbi:hypothetical protein V5O48_016898 [Marasmius crinis-equi]|uniref:Uncharacterized protein n=1 Tax=Marasmius crinis-equi TaxID=585013 RepID=A0ABR3EQG4_9AGAR